MSDIPTQTTHRGAGPINDAVIRVSAMTGSFIGTIGRSSGQVRLRVIHHTDSLTLNQHFQAATAETSRVFCTDDWRGYHQAPRQRQWVCHFNVLRPTCNGLIHPPTSSTHPRPKPGGVNFPADPL